MAYRFDPIKNQIIDTEAQNVNSGVTFGFNPVTGRIEEGVRNNWEIDQKLVEERQKKEEEDKKKREEEQKRLEEEQKKAQENSLTNKTKEAGKGVLDFVGGFIPDKMPEIKVDNFGDLLTKLNPVMAPFTVSEAVLNSSESGRKTTKALGSIGKGAANTVGAGVTMIGAGLGAFNDVYLKAPGETAGDFLFSLTHPEKFKKLNDGQEFDWGRNYSKRLGEAALNNPVLKMAEWSDKEYGTSFAESYNYAMDNPVETGIVTAVTVGTLGLGSVAAPEVAGMVHVLRGGTLTYFGGKLAVNTPAMVGQIMEEPDPYMKLQMSTELLTGWGMVALGVKDMTKGIPTEKTVTKTKSYEVNKSDIADLHNNLVNERLTPEIRQAWQIAFDEQLKSSGSASKFVKDVMKEGKFDVKTVEVVPTMYGNILNAIKIKMGKGQPLTPAEKVVVEDVTKNPAKYTPDEQALVKYTEEFAKRQEQMNVQPGDKVNVTEKPIIENKIEPREGASDLVETPAKPILTNDNTGKFVDVTEVIGKLEDIELQQVVDIAVRNNSEEVTIPNKDGGDPIQVSVEDIRQELSNRDWETSGAADKTGELSSQMNQIREQMKTASKADKEVLKQQYDKLNEETSVIEREHLAKHEPKEIKEHVEGDKYITKEDTYHIAKKGDIVHVDGDLYEVTSGNDKWVLPENKVMRDNNIGYVRYRRAGDWNKASEQGDYLGYTNSVNEMRAATPAEIAKFKELDKGVSKKNVAVEYRKESAKKFKESEAKKTSKPALKPKAKVKKIEPKVPKGIKKLRYNIEPKDIDKIGKELDKIANQPIPKGKTEAQVEKIRATERAKYEKVKKEYDKAQDENTELAQKYADKGMQEMANLIYRGKVTPAALKNKAGIHFTKNDLVTLMKYNDEFAKSPVLEVKEGVIEYKDYYGTKKTETQNLLVFEGKDIQFRMTFDSVGIGENELKVGEKISLEMIKSDKGNIPDVTWIKIGDKYKPGTLTRAREAELTPTDLNRVKQIKEILLGDRSLKITMLDKLPQEIVEEIVGNKAKKMGIPENEAAYIFAQDLKKGLGMKYKDLIAFADRGSDFTYSHELGHVIYDSNALMSGSERDFVRELAKRKGYNTEAEIKEWYSDQLGKFMDEKLNGKKAMGILGKLRQLFESIVERIEIWTNKSLRPHFEELFKGKLRQKTETPKFEVRRIDRYSDLDTPKFVLGETPKDLTIKTVQKLGDRETVSKQFIQDLAKDPTLKQAERDLVTKILGEMPDKVNVKEFSDKVRGELLPLTTLDGGRTAYEVKRSDANFSSQYQDINLPLEERGDTARYVERIYESPIQNEAGNIHWGMLEYDSDWQGGYFAHTRFEDVGRFGETKTLSNGTLETPYDQSTRRILELQSDLFQRGRLKQQEFAQIANLKNDFTPEELAKIKEIADKTEQRVAYTEETRDQFIGTPYQQFIHYLPIDLSIRIDKAGISKATLFDLAKRGFPNVESSAKSLEQLSAYKNTWFERIIREEIYRAAEDNVGRLQFPSGETAMKIEGLGSSNQELQWNWIDENENQNRLDVEDISVGKVIKQGESGDWLVTQDLGDGKFKAVDFLMMENDYGLYQMVQEDWKLVNLEEEGIFDSQWIIDNASDAQRKQMFDYIEKNNLAETFDVSGKIDETNPIYEYYEKDVKKYLKKIRPDFTEYTDKFGNTWYETKITKQDMDEPVAAFVKKQGEYEVDKILNAKETRESIIKRIGQKVDNFRQGIYNEYLPLAKAEADLRKQAGLPKAEFPLDKRFELIAGAEGKAKVDVDTMVERVIKPLNPSEYKDTVRIATLRRIKDRLEKDPDRKKVGSWTIEKAESELQAIESNMKPESLEKINKSLDEYQKVMDKALKLQVQSGRMKQEVYDAIKKENDFYAPFKVMKWYNENGANLAGIGGKVATSQDFAKRISGIENDDFSIGDIFETSAEHLLRSRTLAEKNLAMLDLAKLLEIDKEGLYVKKARPKRSFLVHFSTAQDILSQLSLQSQPLEQSFIKVGKAIQFADELGIELKQKNLPVNLGNATLGTAPHGTVNLRAFTSETVAHELGHIFDVYNGETGVAFGREYFKRLSALVRAPGMKHEMNAIINHRKADAPAKWKSKSTEKFAEYIQLYIHNPKLATELAPTFTERFEKEILPNNQVKGLVEALANFYQKVDKLPNIMTQLKGMDNNYLELAIRRAFPDRDPIWSSIPETKPQPGYEIVNYIKEGKDQAMEVRNDIALALNGRPVQDGLFQKMLAVTKIPLRTAVIPLNLAFQVVNPIFTDIPRLLTMSKYGLTASDVYRFIPDFIYSFYTSLTGNFGHPNKLYKDYLKSGGSNSTFSYGINPDAFRPKIKKLSLGERVKSQLNPITFAKTIINDISKFSNVMEEWSKIAGYKRGVRFEKLDKLAKEIYKMKEEGADPDAIMAKLEEFNSRHQMMASEIRNFTGSPDFAKKGLDGHDINLVFMFFRTKVNEAVSDLGRLAGRDGGAKASAKSWARLTALVGIPALMLALANNSKDKKEDYDSLSQSEKENYFIIFRNSYFTDKNGNRVREAWRIPKRAIVKTVANAIEDSVEYANTQNPMDLANIAYDFLGNISPINISGENVSERIESVIGSTNPLIKAPYEYSSGRNTFFHSDTVPERMKYVSDYLQYKPTTPEFFKKMGELTGQSPLKLEQLANNFGMQLFTQFKNKEVPEDREKWTGYPVVSKFVRSSTSSGDEDTNQMIKDIIQAKADEKQLERGGESSLSYQASLMLQLNAEEKQQVYDAMPQEDAQKLAQELDDYYQAIADARESSGSGSGISSKAVPSSGGSSSGRRTMSIGSLKSNTSRSLATVKKAKKMTGVKKLSGTSVKPIRISIKKPRRPRIKKLSIG